MSVLNITTADLIKLVSGMKYAVVSEGGDAVTEVNGDVTKEWTVQRFRAENSGAYNAIIYENLNGLEIIINLPNGFCVHGICDNTSGLGYLEVAIKQHGRVRFDTPLTNNVIHKVSLNEVNDIINHLNHLDSSGTSYVPGFVPNKEYTRRSILQGVATWIQGLNKKK